MAWGNNKITAFRAGLFLTLGGLFGSVLLIVFLITGHFRDGRGPDAREITEMGNPGKFWKGVAFTAVWAAMLPLGIYLLRLHSRDRSSGT
jgi:hypothetical protein